MVSVIAKRHICASSWRISAALMLVPGHGEHAAMRDIQGSALLNQPSHHVILHIFATSFDASIVGIVLCKQLHQEEQGN
jgi:hypothetical protein